MICLSFNKIKRTTIINLFFIIVVSNNVYSQKNELYNDYGSFGINVDMNQHFSNSNTIYNHLDTPVTFNPRGTLYMSWGFNVVAYKTSHFIHKIGFNISYNAFGFDTNYEAGQVSMLPEGTTVKSWYWFGDYTNYSISLISEYAFQTKAKNGFVLISNIMPTYWKREVSGDASRNYGFNTIVFEIEEKKPTFFIKQQIGIGYYIHTKPLLIEPFIHYTHCFTMSWKGKVTLGNILDRPYSSVIGKFSQRGDYISFGFNLYPEKIKVRLKKYSEK